MEHILKDHYNEFASKGISFAEIPDCIFSAVTQGRVVGYQGKELADRSTVSSVSQSSARIRSDSVGQRLRGRRKL